MNLYSDGKVCLSVLGKDSGSGAGSGDKWNPETSSLWQVTNLALLRSARVGTFFHANPTEWVCPQ